MRLPARARAVAAVALACLLATGGAGLARDMVAAPTQATAAEAPPASAASALTIADANVVGLDAYVYAYPLVMMDAARRVMTNTGPGAPPRPLAAPVNQLAHARTLPDPRSADIVRPSVDTLTSSLWFDVTAEPLVLSLPDAGSRYYYVALLDLWSDVFASLGPRTTGSGTRTFVLTAPGWTGALPSGVERIAAPTPTGWLVGHTATTSGPDLDAAHAFQDGWKAAPLSRWSASSTPAAGTYDPTIGTHSATSLVARLSATAFFARFAELVRTNPPHPNDYPILHRLARIGFEAGRPFDLDSAPSVTRAALQSTPTDAGMALFDSVKRVGSTVNGWRTAGQPIGTYGTDYVRRQAMAYGGLGADLAEDVTLWTAAADLETQPLVGASRYVVHFDAGALPPVHAFWSLTLYDEQQLLVSNALGRYALGSRDPLAQNPDGSLDVVVQRASPGAAAQGNWLPAPKDGRFYLVLRLYWAERPALDGIWRPPTVRVVK